MPIGTVFVGKCWYSWSGFAFEMSMTVRNLPSKHGNQQLFKHPHCAGRGGAFETIGAGLNVLGEPRCSWKEGDLEMIIIALQPLRKNAGL